MRGLAVEAQDSRRTAQEMQSNGMLPAGGHSKRWQERPPFGISSMQIIQQRELHNARAALQRGLVSRLRLVELHQRLRQVGVRFF